MSTDLKHFVTCLCTAEHVPRPENEEWQAMIVRISIPGRIADIDAETYWYFLEVLPPKFMMSGLFAFAEGAEPLRLFWRRGDRHFCRQLTWDETRQFCALAHIELPS